MSQNKEFTDQEKGRLLDLAKLWHKCCPTPEKDFYIESARSLSWDELDKGLSKRISFGTAGLRGRMEHGFSRMNDTTVLQTTQGLVAYLRKLAKDGQELSIVVGYDQRLHSQRFAEVTASVALKAGFRVYYLGTASNLSGETDPSSDDLGDKLYVHTPMVAYGVKVYKALAGVMITASHNPSYDNGYKVYYGNGCQIIPPHDTGIAACIEENLLPWEGNWDVSNNLRKGLEDGSLVLAKEELTKLYVDEVKAKLINSPTISFGFVYTPIHGVGLEIFEKVLTHFELKQKLKVVPEQADPDGTFKTVSFPNPEEKGALDLAIRKADEENVSLVLANDPDADRFSVAFKRKDTGKWQQLTGNEIGILFAAYVIEELTPKEDLKKTWLLNSTVSSQLLGSMADKLHFNFTSTLTGFKWIGNKAIDLKSEGYSVPFGYEEAIGYMFGVVDDKDGISAAVMWLQLYERWFSSGKVDIATKLEEIYANYGYYKECNGYYKTPDTETTPRIFNHTIRKLYPEGEHYPKKLADFDVVEWRDLTLGFDLATSNNKPELPVDASSHMITAVLQPRELPAEKVRFTCRGSGTEPKLKVYIEGRSEQGEEAALDVARKCWNTLRDEWFKPEQNNLEEVV